MTLLTVPVAITATMMTATHWRAQWETRPSIGQCCLTQRLDNGHGVADSSSSNSSALQYCHKHQLPSATTSLVCWGRFHVALSSVSHVTQTSWRVYKAWYCRPSVCLTRCLPL